MQLTHADFGAWLDRYVAAWRSQDPDAIGGLFGSEAIYSYRAGTRVVNGRDAIVEAWLGEEESGPWEAQYEPLAVDDEVHVGIGWTRYRDHAGELRDEYSNIFVCRFDESGNCTSFTEWWMRASKDD